MSDYGIVFGLLDISSRMEDPAVAARLRSFTISWSRYGYHGPIIENNNVNSILDQALNLGYSHCLIQSYGHIISEDWHAPHWNRINFHAAIKRLVDEHEFFAAGHILEGNGTWYGLSDQCLLVNLEYYARLGRPDYHRVVTHPIRLPKPLRGVDSTVTGLGPSWLRPSRDDEQDLLPSTLGWNFVNAGLKGGGQILSFSEAIRRNELNLYTQDSTNARNFARCLTRDQFQDWPGAGEAALTGDQNRFLDGVALQMNNVKRGVFLWNVEPYTDVQSLPPAFVPPLGTLYSVASGLKPNIILHSHGFDHDTRVVFFDYSLNALRIKKLMLEEWDGEDYPRFLQYVFKKFPSPETFYHLWAGLSPGQLRAEDITAYWQDETEKWGGANAIKDHWASYRTLQHEYVHCDILTAPDKLLSRMHADSRSVIWWSNAFFTVYSNWLYTVEERKTIYDSWVRCLARKHPRLFLYGADYNNTSVNFIQAESYLDQYQEVGGDYLRPSKLHKYEIAF